MGNNFIRKGSGLARTPPRHPGEELKSSSNSPDEYISDEKQNQQVNRPFDELMHQKNKRSIETEDPTPISWPSRQSPMGAQQPNRPGANSTPNAVRPGTS